MRAKGNKAPLSHSSLRLKFFICTKSEYVFKPFWNVSFMGVTSKKYRKIDVFIVSQPYIKNYLASRLQGSYND